MKRKPPHLLPVVLCYLVCVMAIPQESRKTEMAEDVSTLLEGVISSQPPNCHLVMIGGSTDTSFFNEFLRRRVETKLGVVLIDTARMTNSSELQDNAQLTEIFTGETTTSCRMLIIAFSYSESDDILEFLERSNLYLWPEIRVLIIGGKQGLNMFKETSSLRNSLYVLYFTQSEGEDPSEANKSKKAIFLNNKMASLKVEASLLSGAYWRCRYCDKGSEKFLALQEPQHHLATQIETRYNDQCKNFNGHNLKVISMLRFPYMDFARLEEQDGKNWGAKIALKDSVDIRMLRTFAEHLNFTYEVREPVDRIWGKYPVEGRWPGIVGPMDREEADFSSVMAPTPSRLTAINHERLYPTDELVLISLKPHIQVDSLALVKPFPENVWAFILISVLVWSVFLWAIENLWAHLSSGHTLNIMDVLFYGFGILLEDTPTFKPTLASGTIMAGWWMMISLVMQSAYRSSLMAHLIVLEKSKPVETFGDLLKLSDWSWGIEPWMLSGAVGVYFQRTQDPVMQQMYQNLELIELEENLQRVEDGKHSFIAWRSPITVTVSSRYAEESRNPFYISRNGYPLLADFGWGFRKGAPFRRHFRQLMTRMMESGILDRWQKEVMDIRVRQNRKERASTPRKDDASSKLKNAQNEDSGRNIVLAMKHLQAAFYFFFCGHGVAFVIFVLELCIVKGKLLLKKQNDLMDL